MGRRRWRHCQNIVDQFWTQFTGKYLPSLQTRQKWQKPSDSLTVESVVLVIDPQLPRAKWPIGKVTKTVVSNDGCVRTANVSVQGKVYTRPVARLHSLPLPAFEDKTEDS